jgi:hypothetical protein
MRRLMALTLALGAACLDCGGSDDPTTGGTSSGSTSSSGSSGTSSSGSSGTSSSSGSTGDAPTLATIQSKIFAGSCVGNMCHGAVGRGGLKLTDTATSCANLVDVAADDSTASNTCGTGGAKGMKRVVAGEPSASFLYLKVAGSDDCVSVNGTGAGERMPKDRSQLSAAQVTMIQQWIAAGASCE